MGYRRSAVIVAILLVVLTAGLWATRHNWMGPDVRGESQLWRSYTGELRRLGGRRLPPELEGYQKLSRALNRWPSGKRQIEALSSRQDGVGYQACLVLARSASVRQEGKAEEYYRRALDLRPDPGVREELARYLEEQGNPAAAAKEWRALLPAGVALTALHRLLGDPILVAACLNDRGMPEQALDILRPRGETEARSRPEAAREWGRALLGTGQVRMALPWLAMYVQAHPDDMDTLSQYALALERSGKLDKARETYERLGTAGARGLGRVLERMGWKKEAARAYLRSPEGEARWQGIRLLEQVGAVDEALSLYEQLARAPGPLRDDAALRAYLLHLRRGRTDRAAEFRPLIGPGLAWCAGIQKEPGLPWNPVPDNVPEPQGARAARALQAVLGGRGNSLAQVEMEVLGRKGGAAGRLALARWYGERGNVTLAAEAAMRALPELPTPSAYRLGYPLPFAELVDEVASDYGLDPFLVWAVIREESHFAPWAVSPAGACGLMQLLPSTAEAAARALGIALKEGDLLRPEINVRLGGWYLARLLESCEGDIPRALAAYNGGLGNVRRWAASPAFAGQEGFPTAIGFAETREYVARVCQSYLVYRYLYGEDSFAQLFEGHPGRG